MFQGFPKDGLLFLSELSQNNSKDWFAQNKQRYKTNLEGPAKSLVSQLEDTLNAQGDDDKAQWHGKIFRFYRDLRFSKDKTPYNTHLRIGLGKEGRTGLYFSLEMDKFTLGAGTFDFPKPRLERYREAVSGPAGQRLSRMLGELKGRGYRLEEPELKRIPKGYAKDHCQSDLLKRKSLTLWWDSITIPELHDERCLALLLGKYEELRGLRMWIEDIL